MYTTQEKDILVSLLTGDDDLEKDFPADRGFLLVLQFPEKLLIPCSRKDGKCSGLKVSLLHK